jgi:hypothetical protein
MTTLKATQRLPDESTAIVPLPSCEGVLATMSLLSKAGHKEYMNYSVLRG